MVSSVVLALMTGCAGFRPTAERQPTHSAFERAVVEREHVASAIAFEARIDALSKQPAGPEEAWFEVLRGTRSVVVSAPHATRPFRNGVYRFSDGPGTAALAFALHRLCGVTSIHAIRDSPSDPNYYDDNDYKRALAGLITEIRPTIVLDIHGSHPSRPYDVDLGTMHGRSLLGKPHLGERLVARLRGEGLVNLSDNRFAASGPETVTKFVARFNVPAIQLEVSATRLQPGRGCVEATKNPSACGSIDSHRFAQLLQALVRYLGDLGQCESPNRSDATQGESTSRPNALNGSP